MLWRPLRRPRHLQPLWTCHHPRQFSDRLRRRHASFTTKVVPTIAGVFALCANDNRESTRIQVAGSVRTIRKQKHRAFLEIGDGSTVHSLQAVLSPEQAQGYDIYFAYLKKVLANGAGCPPELL